MLFSTFSAISARDPRAITFRASGGVDRASRLQLFDSQDVQDKQLSPNRRDIATT
jgi:hypothetical protein